MPSQGEENILREVAGDLENPRFSTEENGHYCVDGKYKSREVHVRCRYTDLHNYSAAIKVEDAPPLLLTARRKMPGEQAAIQRGAVHAIAFGDPEYERDHLVEAVPVDTAKQVTDADVRRAIASTSGRIELTVKRGVVLAGGGGGDYGTSEVREAIAIADLAASRLEAVVAKRRASPPSAEAIAAERAAVDGLKKEEEAFWPRATLLQRIMMVAFIVVMSAVAVACVEPYVRALLQ
jgi:hypothetical protein